MKSVMGTKSAPRPIVEADRSSFPYLIQARRVWVMRDLYGVKEAGEASG